MTWRDRAACAGSNVDFFDFKQEAEALAICHGCAVATECLREALTFTAKSDYGVFGGKTKAERDKLRTKRRKDVAECGTEAGYQRHLRRNETPCDDCREARRQHMADYRARKRGAA